MTVAPNLANGHRRLQTLRKYVRDVPPHYRRRIWRVYEALANDRGIPRRSDGSRPTNQKSRVALADATFRVEDELESRNGGQPDHAAVIRMRAARHGLEADAGWGPEQQNGQPQASAIGGA